MKQLAIAVILGSTRQGRFGDKPAQWIFGHLQERDGITAKLLDLRDFEMPFFDQQVPPTRRGDKPYPYESVQRWTAEIAAADGFVVVTPEYNHAPPAVLKNAIDWVGLEWKRKAVAFVAYGAAGGARAVEHLRGIAVECHLAPVRAAVHLPITALMAYRQGGDVMGALGESNASATGMIDDLTWWASALAVARAG